MGIDGGNFLVRGRVVATIQDASEFNADAETAIFWPAMHDVALDAGLATIGAGKKSKNRSVVGNRLLPEEVHPARREVTEDSLHKLVTLLYRNVDRPGVPEALSAADGGFRLGVIAGHDQVQNVRRGFLANHIGPWAKVTLAGDGADAPPHTRFSYYRPVERGT